MDKQSKILFTAFVVVLIAVVIATYYRAIVVGDYEREWSEMELTTE